MFADVRHHCSDGARAAALLLRGLAAAADRHGEPTGPGDPSPVRRRPARRRRPRPGARSAGRRRPLGLGPVGRQLRRGTAGTPPSLPPPAPAHAGAARPAPGPSRRTRSPGPRTAGSPARPATRRSTASTARPRGSGSPYGLDAGHGGPPPDAAPHRTGDGSTHPTGTRRPARGAGTRRTAPERGTAAAAAATTHGPPARRRRRTAVAGARARRRRPRPRRHPRRRPRRRGARRPHHLLGAHRTGPGAGPAAPPRRAPCGNCWTRCTAGSCGTPRRPRRRHDRHPERRPDAARLTGVAPDRVAGLLAAGGAAEPTVPLCGPQLPAAAVRRPAGGAPGPVRTRGVPARRRRPRRPPGGRAPRPPRPARRPPRPVPVRRPRRGRRVDPRRAPRRGPRTRTAPPRRRQDRAGGVRGRAGGPAVATRPAPPHPPAAGELSFRTHDGTAMRFPARFGRDRELPGPPGRLARAVTLGVDWTVLQYRIPAPCDPRAMNALEREAAAAVALERRYGDAPFGEVFTRVVGYDLDAPEPFVLYRIADAGPLATLGGALGVAEQQRILAQLVLAVRLLDAAGFVHRAIGPETVRWDGRHVRLCEPHAALRTGEPREAAGAAPWASPNSGRAPGRPTPRRPVVGGPADVLPPRRAPRPGRGPPADLADFRGLTALAHGGAFHAAAAGRPAPAELMRLLNAPDPLAASAGGPRRAGPRPRRTRRPTGPQTRRARHRPGPRPRTRSGGRRPAAAPSCSTSSAAPAPAARRPAARSPPGPGPGRTGAPLPALPAARRLRRDPPRDDRRPRRAHPPRPERGTPARPRRGRPAQGVPAVPARRRGPAARTPRAVPQARPARCPSPSSAAPASARPTCSRPCWARSSRAASNRTDSSACP